MFLASTTILLLVVQAPQAKEAPAAAAVEAEVRRLEAARSPAEANAALDALLAHQLDADELARAAVLVSRRHVSLAGERFLRAVAERSASGEARGFATWALAQVLLEFEQALAFLEDPALERALRESAIERRGKELVDELSKRGREALREEALKLLRKVVEDHYFLEWRPTGYLGAAADAQLFELERLQIGMVAPEIEGVDEDGVPFKLSDYRGKVVALDFWGFWCPICVRNLPAERELVQRVKDEPFALVGVNSDPKARLEDARRLDPIAWRSFFDGGDAYGPIARQWNVAEWPTIYVLDEDGVIRLRTEDAEQMARKVEELLAARKADSTASKPGG
jgi:peroxiredoxin